MGGEDWYLDSDEAGKIIRYASRALVSSSVKPESYIRISFPLKRVSRVQYRKHLKCPT